ncbi:winged helix-turn-helix transcriptional regulator [Desulfovibrio piger]|nr:winged helix-turn-helix transcriptional regulator [Desulfovibrio piger]
MTVIRSKKISSCLGIKIGTLYQHLAEIRKRMSYHSSVKVLFSYTNIPCQNAALADMGFTPRGKEVFLLIIEGLSNRQIAEQLSISPSAVKRHREKMLLQNRCTSMMELVAKYLRLCELHDSGLSHETLFPR